MRHFIFGHQCANESLVKPPPLFCTPPYNTGDTPHHKPPPPLFYAPLYNPADIPQPLLVHTSKIIARDFPSVRKSKLAFSARPLASAAPIATYCSCHGHMFEGDS